MKTESNVPYVFISFLGAILMLFLYFALWSEVREIRKDITSTVERPNPAQQTFLSNEWFQAAAGFSGKETNGWVGTVLDQRPLMAGIHQMKVERESDKTLFLVLSGREKKAGDRVVVKMYAHKAWAGVGSSFTHFLAEEE